MGKKKRKQRKQEQRKTKRKQKKAKKQASKSAESSPAKASAGDSLGAVREIKSFEDLLFVRRMQARIEQEERSGGAAPDDDRHADDLYADDLYADDPYADEALLGSLAGRDPFSDGSFSDEGIMFGNELPGGVSSLEQGPPEVLWDYEAALDQIVQATTKAQARAVAEQALEIHPYGYRARALRAANAPTPAQKAAEMGELVEKLRSELTSEELALAGVTYGRARFYLEVLSDLGAALTECQRYEEAVEVLAELRRLEPDDDPYEMCLVEVRCLVALGRAAEARELLNDDFLDDCCLCYGEALVAWMEDDRERAQSALEAAWARDHERRWVEPERCRRIAEVGRGIACAGLRRGDVCRAETLWAVRPEALGWLEERLAERSSEPTKPPDYPASSPCSGIMIPFEELAFAHSFDRPSLLELDEETGAALGEVEAILAHLDRVCLAHLDGEYRLVCRLIARDLFLDHRELLLGGKPRSVAAGIATVAAQVNFLSDPEFSPTMPLKDLAVLFGVSAATASKRASTIKERLKLSPHDWRLMLPSRMERNPMVWMCEGPGGRIRDIREAPARELRKALAQGQIPFLPGDLASKEDCIAELADSVELVPVLVDFIVPDRKGVK